MAESDDELLSLDELDKMSIELIDSLSKQTDSLPSNEPVDNPVDLGSAPDSSNSDTTAQPQEESISPSVVEDKTRTANAKDLTANDTPLSDSKPNASKSENKAKSPSPPTQVDFGLAVDKTIDQELNETLSSSTKKDSEQVTSPRIDVFGDTKKPEETFVEEELLSMQSKEDWGDDKANKPLSSLSDDDDDDQSEDDILNRSLKDAMGAMSASKGLDVSQSLSGFSKDLQIAILVGLFFSAVSLLANIFYFKGFLSLIFFPLATFFSWIALVVLLLYVLKAYFPEFSNKKLNSSDKTNEGVETDSPSTDGALDSISVEDSPAYDEHSNPYLAALEEDDKTPATAKQGGNYIEGMDFSFEDKDMAKAVSMMINDQKSP